MNSSRSRLSLVGSSHLPFITRKRDSPEQAPPKSGNGTSAVTVQFRAQWIGRRYRFALETGIIIKCHHLITDVSPPACLLKEEQITWGKLLMR